jgi:hypothetical protein
MFTHTILEFGDQKKPKKKMIFCNKFEEIRCFMIVIPCTCDKVDLYQFCYMNRLEVYLENLILKHVMCVKF